MATNWVEVKLAYINSSKTQREIADDFGIKASGLMARAAKERWDGERKKKQAEVSKLAQAGLTETIATRLAKFNDQDAKVAEALKAKAARMLQEDGLDDRKLANLARVFDSAQKIGLLALGAATGKHEFTGKDGGAIPIANITVSKDMVNDVLSKLNGAI